MIRKVIFNYTLNTYHGLLIYYYVMPEILNFKGQTIITSSFVNSEVIFINFLVSISPILTSA